MHTLLSAPRSFKALLPLVAAALLTCAAAVGCTGTRPASPPDADAEPPTADASDEPLVQTGTRSSAEGNTMPLGRSVSFLESPSDGPVTDDTPSSAAYLRRASEGAPAPRAARYAERVEALLGEMTLEEKVGQMTQVELGVLVEDREAYPQEIDPEKLRTALREYHVGSVLNVVNTAFTPEHWQRVIGQVQAEAGRTRLGIPVVYGIDAVHGTNYTRGAALFPQQLGLAATWNPALTEQVAAITARDTRASGIPWNFSPVLDVGREPRWSRFYETFGEDAYLSSVMGVAMVRGYQGADLSAPTSVAACLKHFVGYSGPNTGRDRTPALIPDRVLREQYLPPFRAAVEAGAWSVMINSGEVDGIPAHASEYLLTDVLRGELGFEGVVVSDWQDIMKLVNIHRVAATEKEATRIAVMAGVDMSMVPSSFSFAEHLVELVEEDAVPMTRIDEAVGRILRLKLALGLFEDPNPGASLAEQVGTEDDRRVSLQAARESVTLLRNRSDLLPLDGSEEVLVTGPTAHSMQSLHGGWTYTWQGGGEALEMYPAGVPTLMEAVRTTAGDEQMTYVPGATLTSASGMDEAVEAARRADVAVVALGEGAYAETPGNVSDFRLPEAQRVLLERIAETGTPVVLVMVAGRPRVIGPGAEEAEAVLMAYQPGPEGGQALAEVLYGEVNPSGHLPFTYPRQTAALVPYDHKTSDRQDTEYGMDGFDPLFEFGHGLSYTTFEHTDLEISRASMSGDALAGGQMLEARVTVRNTGDRSGRDIVPLYLTDEVATVTPSVKKLRRFAKVMLEPGEARTLVFRLNAEDFAFVGPDGRPTAEAGTFQVRVGTMAQPFELESDIRQDALVSRAATSR